MTGTYATLVVAIVLATTVGTGLGRLAGRRGFWWPGPAVGLGALLLVCAIAIKLPGHEWTATIAAGLLVLVTLPFGLRALVAAPAAALGAAAIALCATLAVSIPFVVHERVGLLGLGLNNDTSVHLLWSEGLRDPAMARLYPLSTNYPLGPHSLMAVLATVTGVEMDRVMTALLLVAPPLIAVAAVGLLDALPWWRRAIAAVLAGVSYLVVAYFGQGAFKEILQALFLLAFVVGVRELARVPAGERVRLAAVLATLPAAAVYTYSYVALAWFAGALGLWLAVEFVFAVAGRARPLATARAWVPVAAIAAGVVIVALLPDIGRLRQFFGAFGVSPNGGSGGIASSDLGNLAGPLSPYEALGLWPTADFRFAPANGFHGGELAAVALGVAVFAVVWWLRRGERLAVAAAIAGAVIFFAARHTGQSPYLTAKALVIVSPLAMALGAGAILGFQRRPGTAWYLQAALAAVFVLGAASSSLASLRWSPVAPTQQRDQLAELRPVLGDTPTLFMGMDDFVGWRLRDVSLAWYSTTGFKPSISMGVRPNKPYQYGNPVDFDSFSAADLDRFGFVIAPRSAYESAPPANFTLERRTPLYDLFRRTGPTPPRDTIEGGEAPGRVLDCTKEPDGRKLAARSGTAGTRVPPVVSPEVGALAPGGAADPQLTVAGGDWDVSLQYASPDPLLVQVPGRRFEMPPNLDRPGPFFYAGRFRARAGQVRLHLVHEKRSRLASPQDAAFVRAIALTRPGSDRVIPLRRICGAWVDWYRLGG